MRDFTSRYLADLTDKPLEILDLGSADIGGTYAQFFNHPKWRYRGVDLVEGPNIHVVLSNPYNWRELPTHCADVFVSGQTFEHIEFFWLTMREIARVLKPGGLCCIVAPSRGPIHRYPVDCWRFYPDGFAALARYADLEILEILHDEEGGPTYPDKSEEWGDLVLIAQRKSDKLNATQKSSLSSGADLNKVLEGIIRRGSRILKIGSACPKLEKLLRADMQCELQDIDPETISHTEQHSSVYDTIIALDTLEHSNDPESVLTRAFPALKEDGTLIVGVHNLAHASVIGALCLGEDPFSSLTPDNMPPKRFFTKQSVCAMLQKHGFFPHRIDLISKAPHETSVGNTPGELPLPIEEFLISRPEALTYQILVSAKKVPAPEIQFERTDSLAISRHVSQELIKKIQMLEEDLILQKAQLELATNEAEKFKQNAEHHYDQLSKEYALIKDLADNRDHEIKHVYERLHNLQVNFNNVNKNPALYALKFFTAKLKNYINRKRVRDEDKN